MKRRWSILCAVFAVVLFGSGCAYLRPSQTESQRLQAEQNIRKDEYLKGTFVDGLVRAAGSYLSHSE